MIELAQFPLESVVLPSQVLQLHIFEPRYRQLIEDLLDGDRRFGVVMITRGSEVGGSDQRAEIGTVVELHEAVQLDDGRWFITAAGLERYRIDEWLEDDPYPRATVSVLDEHLLADGHQDVEARIQTTTREFVKAMAMVSELGGQGAPEELSTNADVALYQMSVLLPLGPLDKYKLLAAPSSLDRLSELEQLIGDTNDLLRYRLAEG